MAPPQENEISAADLDFFRNIWKMKTAGMMVENDLFRRFEFEGGYDYTSSDLNDNDLHHLITGDFNGNWNEVQFVFGELNAYYYACAIHDGLSDLQLVAWVFSCLCLKAVGNIYFSFDTIIETFSSVAGKLSVDEWMYFFSDI
ncbi:MAG: hypothetical protein PHQ27_08335 [Victivallales bacterium]|nr:hypothetical protein [Victivallales bacterium]